MEQLVIDRISEKYDLKKREIRKKIKEETKREPDFRYMEDLNGSEGLKPTKKIIKIAKEHLLKNYLDVLADKRYGGNVYYYGCDYVTYTEIVKGEVKKYQFVYYVSKEKGKDIFNFEKNIFTLTLAYNYKTKKGLTNEKYKYSGMAGYVFRHTNDDFIIWYNYSKIKKRGREGGFKWHATSLQSEDYKKLKINDFFYLNNSKTEEHITQRILSLNPNHVEMLYKMGFENLYYYRFSDKKIEFIKKNIKELDKKITHREISKAYTLVKKGLKINMYKEILKILTIQFNPYEYNFDRKVKTTMSYYGSDTIFLTKTEDTKKLLRIYNLIKEFGIQHIIDLRGCCYRFELNFDDMIFKSLRMRTVIIDEWQEQKIEHNKEQKRIADRLRRERIKKQNLGFKSLEEFKKTHEVIYEVIKEGYFKDYCLIKEIDKIEVDRKIDLTTTNMEEVFEEAKEIDNFYKRNKIIIENTKTKTNITSINGEKTKINIYDPNRRTIYVGARRFLEEKRVAKLSLEDITSKLNYLERKDFKIEPLKTIKDLTDFQEKMKLCLMNNDYASRIKKEELFLFVAYKNDMKSKYEGEVIEFRIKNKEIKEVGQIAGYDNKNTVNYEKIKQIAHSLKYKDIVREQNQGEYI
jgi:hypothetical protein